MIGAKSVHVIANRCFIVMVLTLSEQRVCDMTDMDPSRSEDEIDSSQSRSEGSGTLQCDLVITPDNINWDRGRIQYWYPPGT